MTSVRAVRGGRPNDFLERRLARGGPICPGELRGHSQEHRRWPKGHLAPAFGQASFRQNGAQRHRRVLLHASAIFVEDPAASCMAPWCARVGLRASPRQVAIVEDPWRLSKGSRRFPEEAASQALPYIAGFSAYEVPKSTGRSASCRRPCKRESGLCAVPKVPSAPRGCVKQPSSPILGALPRSSTWDMSPKCNLSAAGPWRPSRGIHAAPFPTGTNLDPV